VPEHVLGRRVERALASGDLLIRFPFPGQPLRREEPCLVRRDRHVAADRYGPILPDRELHLVALADVQGASDLLGQRQLRLGAHLDPCAESWLRLHLRCQTSHVPHSENQTF